MNKNIAQLRTLLQNPAELNTPATQTLFANLDLPESGNLFASQVDPNEFFRLGEILRDSDLDKIVYVYLDIFRQSSFLNRIYEEQRWSHLILDLLQMSNYTLATLFQRRVAKYPKKILFTVMEPANQRDYTWAQIREMVELYARALFTLRGKSADSGPVAFLCKNSLEMALFDLACLTTGIENIMIPANSVQVHIEYILNYTKPSVLIISDQELLTAVLPLLSNSETHMSVIMFEKSDQHPDNIFGLDQIPALAERTAVNEVTKCANKVNINERATIMFTSGTTGNPKGIMFSQQNIVSKRFARAMAIPGIGEQDIFLSYLPLCHTFGRWLELTGSLFWCARYVFMENPSVEAMLENMQRIKPSIFISIPKKWYQLYERVEGEVDVFHDEDKKIRDAISKLTGGNLKWGLSAAGHLDVEVFQFLQKFGIELMSGFGMTEATGGITMTPPGGYRPNSLGKALPGIELKYLDDGELLIRGPYVTIGYVNPEDAGMDFIDGWLPTGDIMKVDRDGYISIIDRKKEIYKNIKGETIAPQKIENYFFEMEFVKSVFLVGDHKAFNTLLIYPNYESKEVNFKDMDSAELRGYFSSVIVSVNQFLSPFERIVDFRIIKRDFDPAKNELTAKGTFRRKNIEKNFSEIIDQLYLHEFFPVHIKNYDIRIPTWFIRECGVTQSEVLYKDNRLSITGSDTGLDIKISKTGIQLGDFRYTTGKKSINLGVLLQSPNLWLGNDNLVLFTSNNIFKWSRNDEADDKIQVLSVVNKRVPDELDFQDDWDELERLHYSARLLYSGLREDRQKALTYLEDQCRSSLTHLAFYAKEVLRRTIYEKNQALQEMTIPVMIDTLQKDEFQDLLDELLGRIEFKFSASLITSISKKRLKDENLNVLFISIRKHCTKLNKNCESLFKLLSEYGTYHPAQYKNIRRFLIDSQLLAFYNEISNYAGTGYDRLKIGFRKWLGTKQTVAVDIETSEEYSWDNVITFEEEINLDDRTRLFEAITKSTILREAIFLFSKGALVRLHDIPPGGVWVSLLGSDHGKSVYRVTVQTRYQGSFDLAINLNHKLRRREIVDEIKWLIQAGSIGVKDQLVEDFGGYWPEYELWSEEYIPGETSGKFLRRIARQNKKVIIERLQLLWPYFIWNGTAGYVKFWMRTGRTKELLDPSPENIIVPVHDYQTGTRIVSISSRKEHEDILSMLLNIFNKFVSNTENEFAALKNIGKYIYIFSGLIEAMGIESGIIVLKECLELCKLRSNDDSITNFTSELEAYIDTIEDSGYLPQKLYFAIKRYHRWLKVTKNATIEARAETLIELYNTYELHNLEKENSETRTRFFTATVFEASSADLLVCLDKIIRGQRTGIITSNNLGQYISAIQNDLSLREDEIYFLTRLTYPHLSPTDSADLITLEAGGVSDMDVMVLLEDYDGEIFRVRTPVNPKEITRLHQLFLNNNLPVKFTPEHRYLIALNERGHLIGGLFFSVSDQDSVHIEKIVVINSYRKKGVSDGLLNDFFKRMKSEHRRYVTTGFFRPEYFYRFGFKTERKYAGLVRKL